MPSVPIAKYKMVRHTSLRDEQSGEHTGPPPILVNTLVHCLEHPSADRSLLMLQEKCTLDWLTHNIRWRHIVWRMVAWSSTGYSGIPAGLMTMNDP